MCEYLYIYTHAYVHMLTCIYAYLQRERERERNREEVICAWNIVPVLTHACKYSNLEAIRFT